MEQELSIQLKQKILVIFPVMFIFFPFSACKREFVNHKESAGFVLTSLAIKQDSLLPADYTCDGSGATLPLAWTGFPDDTKWFALIMYTVASPTDIHWYWILYNIPGSVQSLVKNVSGVGTLGNNSLNNRAGYSPPCSQGPGYKYYVFTLYALSQSLAFTVPSQAVSMEVLLDAVKNITLSSASLTVKYSRNIP